MLAATFELRGAASALLPVVWIYTDTRAGVVAVVRGDLMEGRMAGLGALNVRVKG